MKNHVQHKKYLITFLVDLKIIKYLEKMERIYDNYKNLWMFADLLHHIKLDILGFFLLFFFYFLLAHFIVNF